jgi:hypothetical protein
MEKRMFDGKNLYRVLSKCMDQEDIRIKVFELVFLVCFLSKDNDTSKVDAYVEDSRKFHLNIFNHALSSLDHTFNPVLTKCILQIVGDILK